MKTLKIEIPEGFEVDHFDQTSGEIRFKPKPKNVIDRIKTIEDVVKDNGYEDLSNFQDCYYDLKDDEKAYILIKMLCASLNEGWTPDWDNSSESKYVPWFDMSSGFRFDDDVYWGTDSFVGSRLCFKSSELARYAGQQFTDLYRQFFVIKSTNHEQAENNGCDRTHQNSK